MIQFKRIHLNKVDPFFHALTESRAMLEIYRKGDMEHVYTHHNKRARTWRRHAFVDEDLRHADFCGMDLRECRFDGCQLTAATFNAADLRGASFARCYINSVDFTYANMDGVLFASDRNKSVNAYFAAVRVCNFSHALMRNADLSQAVFRDCKFQNTKLKGTDVGEHVLSRFSNIDFLGATCIPKGIMKARRVLPTTSFTAWKRCAEGRLVELHVPADAKRSAGLSNKCRASKVVTVSIASKLANKCKNARSLRDTGGQDCAYRVGYETVAHNFDPNPWKVCAGGIHFFMTAQEAIDYAWR